MYVYVIQTWKAKEPLLRLNLDFQHKSCYVENSGCRIVFYNSHPVLYIVLYSLTFMLYNNLCSVGYHLVLLVF